MKSGPLVSIVIPNMERLDLLKRALNSVLTQTYGNFEVVIVDDSTQEVFDKLKMITSEDERIKLIRGDGTGDATARKKGVEVSEGELVAFLDSDDEWCPEKIANHVSVWNSYSDIGFTWDLWKESGITNGITEGNIAETSAESVKMKGQRVFAYLWVTGNFIHMSSGVAKRDYIQKLGGFPITNPCDWHLWLMMSRKYDGVLINKILTHKIIDQTGLGRNKWRMVAEYMSTLKVRSKIFRFLSLEGTISFRTLLKYALVIPTYWLFILFR